MYPRGKTNHCFDKTMLSYRNRIPREIFDKNFDPWSLEHLLELFAHLQIHNSPLVVCDFSKTLSLSLPLDSSHLFYSFLLVVNEHLYHPSKIKLIINQAKLYLKRFIQFSTLHWIQWVIDGFERKPIWISSSYQNDALQLWFDRLFLLEIDWKFSLKSCL